MKNLLSFLFLASITLYNPQNVDYTTFSRFVMTRLRLPEAIKRNCTWQYIIIKISTDKNNRISSYQIENKPLADLTNEFSYLKGYQFDKKLKLSNHNIVFFISLINDRVDDCDITPTNKKSDAERVFKQYEIDHIKIQPKNIYIKEIMYSIIYDSVK